MQVTNTSFNSRRAFIKKVSMASLFLLSGNILKLKAEDVFDLQDKVQLRFIVGSDIHFGQQNTFYETLIEDAVKSINKQHVSYPASFTVFNGDLIHDDSSYLLKLKDHLAKVNMPYYVTRGNHDTVTDLEWKSVWGYALNHSIDQGEYAIVLGDTSNAKGEYLSPNLEWLEATLDQYSSKKNVFIFLHIPQAKWTSNGIQNPAFFTLLKKYKNVRAVFHGHEHDQDGVRMVGTIPFLFDAHIGGNWGTSYKGFRVVELLEDQTLLSYMMNPIQKLNAFSHQL